MSRYSRARSDNVSFIIIVLVGTAAYTHRTELVHIAYIAFGVMCCLLLLKLSWKLLGHHRFAKFKNIDAMDGLEFEYYVAELLRRNGFYNISLTEKYDFGVDIVAKKDGVTWGVQVKHYRNLVGIEAVRQVVVGLKKYKCNRSMVITNSIFSRPAIELAKSQDCILISGDKLS